jgi:hypothetical protein
MAAGTDFEAVNFPVALGPRALKERRLYGRRARELGNLWMAALVWPERCPEAPAAAGRDKVGRTE